MLQGRLRRAIQNWEDNIIPYAFQGKGDPRWKSLKRDVGNARSSIRNYRCPDDNKRGVIPRKPNLDGSGGGGELEFKRKPTTDSAENQPNGKGRAQKSGQLLRCEEGSAQSKVCALAKLFSKKQTASLLVFLCSRRDADESIEPCREHCPVKTAIRARVRLLESRIWEKSSSRRMALDVYLS